MRSHSRTRRVLSSLVASLVLAAGFVAAPTTASAQSCTLLNPCTAVSPPQPTFDQAEIYRILLEIQVQNQRYLVLSSIIQAQSATYRAIVTYGR